MTPLHKTYRYPDRTGKPVSLPGVLAPSLGLPISEIAQAPTYGDIVKGLATPHHGIRVDLTHNGRRYTVHVDPDSADTAVYRQEQLARTLLTSGALRRQLVDEAMKALETVVDVAKHMRA